MNILIVSPFFPLPLKSGGHTRLFNMIKRLSSDHVVDFISPVSGNEGEYKKDLLPFCREVVTINVDDITLKKIRNVLRRGNARRLAFRLWSFLRGVPPEISGFYFPEMREQLDVLLRSHQYDVVQLELSRMALYFNKSFFKKHPACKILVDYDLCFLPLLRTWACEKKPLAKGIRYLDYKMHRAWALKMWKLFDAMVVMSETDREKVIARLPHLPVHVVSNGVDLSYFRPCAWKGPVSRLLFLGGAGHYANIDALRYFLNDIFPFVKNSMRNVFLTVIGDGWEAHRERLSGGAGVQFTGFVDDVRVYADRPAVLVAPIRIGGGTRLKILEAMAMGVPVVSTSVGCEGIPVQDREHMLIADTPGEFASKVKEACSNEQLRCRLREKAYTLVKENYGWDALALRMEKVYEDAVGAL